MFGGLYGVLPFLLLIYFLIKAKPQLEVLIEPVITVVKV